MSRTSSQSPVHAEVNAMPRAKITRQHPEVLRHVTILAQHGFTLRAIAEMVSTVNGVRLSHTTVAKILQGRGFESLHEPKLYKRSDRSCPECQGSVQNAFMPDEVCCVKCGLVLKEREAPIISKEMQLGQYMPANHINFQRLGQGNPDALLINAINQASPELSQNGEYKLFLQKLWKLKSFLGIDDRLRKLKDKAKKRLSELGFNEKKDYLVSDEVGKLLEAFYERHVKPMPQCFQMKDYDSLVEALIVCHLGEPYRAKLEKIEKKLVCPRCRKPRSYILDKSGKNYLCMQCGKQIPTAKARFKVKAHSINEKYVSLIREALREVSDKVVAQ